MKTPIAFLGFTLLLSAMFPDALAKASSDPIVEFNRDVRPILSDNCFQCHGPDRVQRKADLRLDLEAFATLSRDGRRAVSPGRPEESELLERIASVDPEERMPPPASGKTLSKRQVETIRRWITQGAKWQPHWSFIAPRAASPPTLKKHHARALGKIDRFVLVELEKLGVDPSPEADRQALIRRLSFDVTGLPPAPRDVDEFLRDSRPDAYERLVDRLLASSRYGERMASRWLDAARYADTNGYQDDGERQMWRWRDWVIEAFNKNMPFDRFTVEQLAGDLLPEAGLDQIIATGFNRNHRINAEGGIIPEEYAVEYVVDRVETTSTVWLGLTLGCTRCHDHKFDPFSQEEFYRLFAYFNNIPERGRGLKYGNSPPLVRSPTRDQQAVLSSFDDRIARARKRFDESKPNLDANRSNWERELREGEDDSWTLTEGLAARHEFDPIPTGVQDRYKSATLGGSSVRTRGISGLAGEFDGKRFVELAGVGGFGFDSRFTVSAWVKLDDPRGGIVFSRMKDESNGDGYGLALRSGRLQPFLVKRYLDDALRLEVPVDFKVGEWHHVVMSYDGTKVASGTRVHVDGVRQDARIVLDELNQTFKSEEPFRIGGGDGPESRFRGAIDDVRVYERVLDDDEVQLLAVAESVKRIAERPASERTVAQQRKLDRYLIERHSSKEHLESKSEIKRLVAERLKFEETVPTTMVMRELSTPRPTFVLNRGQYDRPTKRVEPGLPGSLVAGVGGSVRSRLEFARWVASNSNPLTARVFVNRVWQMLFGVGLVKTVEDFGSQGEVPRHQELLDTLATDFVDSGWNVKKLIRDIVTSGTYRQASRTSTEFRARDPENRLLARGPRLRLSAEMIRDQALAISGLLVEKTGGPSVRPYQPPGLWKDLTEGDYKQDEGEGLYRRSLYTFWKRTIAPPTMMTFDASGREACSVRESRTNTPLQALTLLNEATFVEAARMTASRSLAEGGATDEERLAYAFRLCTSRAPTSEELGILKSGLQDHVARYRGDSEGANRLTGHLAAGDRGPSDASRLAAYTAVCGMLLNLDETITKE